MIETNRQTGIDILKNIAMFMVVLLHVIGHGGLLNSLTRGTLNYHITCLIEIASYSAVNIFAITTGYLMADKAFKSERILHFWGQIFFYSFAITAIFALLYPGSLGLKVLVQAVLPISAKSWWYASAFFMLLLCFPFINKLLATLSKRETLFLLSIIMFISGVSTFIPLDAFAFFRGYSAAWLICLYIIGAAIKRYDLGVKIRNFWFILIYLGAVVLTVLSLFKTRLLVGYLSPTVILMAVSLFLFFSSMHCKKTVCKFFEFITPLSFAVYLISDHNLIRGHFISGKFSYLGNESVGELLTTLFGVTALIFAVCILIEYIRGKLFKITGITFMIKRIGNFIDHKINI